MIRLFKIELHKIKGNTAFWIILGLYTILFMPLAFALDGILDSFSININGQEQPSLSDALLQGFSVFNFPHIWQNLAYM
ncbi:MAG: hypothetical protein MRY83_05775, partial [Flavobacteriales bacterium]|nr:hypothetical protein [Flavobacteriales bacterium]